jgi:hypothetical protein
MELLDYAPYGVLVISIFALYFSVRFSRKNVRLSIQQSLSKIVLDKTFDCNKVWNNEPESEKNESSPHYLVVSELIITIEIVNKSIDIFKKNYKSIIDDKEDYYYIFWKQLTPDIRGWTKRKCEELADIDNQSFEVIYTDQIKTISRTFKKFFE